jgi:acyl transferase domain-containing protein/phosphopantetheinyl transferase (holo-ACP synthase)
MKGGKKNAHNKRAQAANKPEPKAPVEPVVSAQATPEKAEAGSAVKSEPKPAKKAAPVSSSAKVAIVGMSCLFPGAPDLASFWSNIIGAVDATREVGEAEWDLEKYYDPDGQSKGLSYSKRGGFVSEYADFDPLKFGVMPSAVAGSDPDQFLTLRVALAAMQDAGYDLANIESKSGKKLDRDRAEIILGRIGAPGTGSMNLIQQSKTVHELRAILKEVMAGAGDEVIEAVVKQMQEKLVPCTPDNIPGAMPNVLAGRVAAKLGFRGRNLLVDAACASSMVAIETAVNDLLDKRCDFALAGGVHINASAVFFQMFCGLGALSHADNIRPFDAAADGTMLGEGVGVLCLKRLEDAIADGDRIYSTICGIASSSDGHGGSVLAPSVEGEALAMQKAYAMAGISPGTVQLLEAHGTGTPVGDVAELQAVAKVFSADIKEGEQPEAWCAVGSIKSMIGHCQSASAVAGVIKASLALHHKIIPPTLHVSKPNPKVDWATHPCYVNTKTRPWIKADGAEPRRAAVSAFGFGGVNGHMVMEEMPTPGAIAIATGAYESEVVEVETSLMPVWERELFTFCEESEVALKKTLSDLAAHLQALPSEGLSDSYLKNLAYSVNCKNRNYEQEASLKAYRLAFVVASPTELLDKVTAFLAGTAGSVREYYSEPEGALRPIGGKLAFLYPGLGSAYTNMLADLCMHFPEVRAVFEIVDNVALSAGAAEPPSRSIFPPPFEKGERTVPTLLAAADFAVVAVLLAEYAIWQLLAHLGVKPDVIMGCSTGEFAAITTTGSVDVLSVAETFYRLSTRVARSIPEESLAKLRTIRVLSSWQKVEAMAVALGIGKIYLSADLGDSHIIVTGDVETIDALTAKLKDERVPCQLLPVPIPYHTPLVASIIDANNEAVQAVDIQPLAIPGWSCSTAQMYPPDVESMRLAFVELFTRPIALKDTVQAMHEDGVRIFVEVGPNGILTSAMDGILGAKPHLAVPSNLASRSGVTQIQHLLAALFVQGRAADLAFLYKRRSPALVDWQTISQTAAAGVGTKSGAGKKLGVKHTSLTVEVDKIADYEPLVPQSLAGAYYDDASGQYDSEYDDDSESDQSASEAVLQTFLTTNTAFYSKLNAISSEVMRSYIQGEGELAGGEDDDQEEDQEENYRQEDEQEDEQEEIEAELEAESEENFEAEPVQGHDNFLEPAPEAPSLEPSLQSFIEQSFEIEDPADLPAQIAAKPFLRRSKVVFKPDAEGGETEVYLKLNLADDLYLHDHAIGGYVSTLKKLRVHLVPLMVTLEIMAEAALAHIRWGVPVRIANVRAYRRIVVDNDGLTLKAIARGDADKTMVSLVDADDHDTVYATAEFIYSEYYIDHPNYEGLPQLAFNGELPVNLNEHSKLYQCGPLSMFHGPSMQAVETIAAVGNKAIGGLADGAPARNWLTGIKGYTDFLVHPLLLDNASQFVLFYLYEKNLSATALLPFLIETVDLSQGAERLESEVTVTAVLPTLTERATEANVEVVSKGKLAMKITGINSRRVLLTQQWQDFVADPAGSYLGSVVPVTAELAQDGVIMQVEQSILPEDDVILEWCLDYLLTRAEQQTWKNLGKTKKRKIDWLLGRIAAKEAVRKIVHMKTGLLLGPHDVEILKLESGAPVVKVSHGDSMVPALDISISHTKDVAVAFATVSGGLFGRPGIDAEVVRQYEPDFAATFLQPHELQYLAGCPSDRASAELTRLWSAKEALYKACHGAHEMSSFALAGGGPPAPNADVFILAGGVPRQETRAYLSISADRVIAYTVL